MRRNPLLYSDPSEAEDAPKHHESTQESSFLFYFIITANSLLVLFVLGFIWFLFLKSPDLQLKELSNRLFGTNLTIEQVQQLVPTPEIKPEVIITPSQQEKDETQQAKLKQMREKEELAAERTRLEAMKSEIEKERIRANEAKQAIENLQPLPKTAVALKPAIPATLPSDAPAAKVSTIELEEPAVVPNAATEPVTKTNSTSSQVDLIMEVLKDQAQQKIANDN